MLPSRPSHSPADLSSSWTHTLTCRAHSHSQPGTHTFTRSQPHTHNHTVLTFTLTTTHTHVPHTTTYYTLIQPYTHNHTSHTTMDTHSQPQPHTTHNHIPHITYNITHTTTHAQLHTIHSQPYTHSHTTHTQSNITRKTLSYHSAVTQAHIPVTHHSRSYPSVSHPQSLTHTFHSPTYSLSPQGIPGLRAQHASEPGCGSRAAGRRPPRRAADGTAWTVSRSNRSLTAALDSLVRGGGRKSQGQLLGAAGAQNPATHTSFAPVASLTLHLHCRCCRLCSDEPVTDPRCGGRRGSGGPSQKGVGTV